MVVVPWWALLSSGCAFVALVVGWALGASLQPADYSPMFDSISALAANGAADAWLMTGALYVLGACHLITAFGLRVAAMPGRVVLALGGFASFAVALSPEPIGGTSLRHLISTAIGFTLLAIFPVLAAWRGPSPTWPLKRTTGYAVTTLMAAGAAWFLTELHGHGIAGLAERILTAAQTLWPFVIVVACITATRSEALAPPLPVATASLRRDSSNSRR